MCDKEEGRQNLNRSVAATEKSPQESPSVLLEPDDTFFRRLAQELGACWRWITKGREWPFCVADCRSARDFLLQFRFRLYTRKNNVDNLVALIDSAEVDPDEVKQKESVLSLARARQQAMALGLEGKVFCKPLPEYDVDFLGLLNRVCISLGRGWRAILEGRAWPFAIEPFWDAYWFFTQLHQHNYIQREDMHNVYWLVNGASRLEEARKQTALEHLLNLPAACSVASSDKDSSCRVLPGSDPDFSEFQKPAEHSPLRLISLVSKKLGTDWTWMLKVNGGEHLQHESFAYPFLGQMIEDLSSRSVIVGRLTSVLQSDPDSQRKGYLLALLDAWSQANIVATDE